jgi:GNAT superfamily N-acetyltransferase
LVSDVTPDRVVREDVVLRELSAPSDWSQVAALELEHSAEAELDFAEFFAWRTRMVRRDAECGRALVWGAFAGDSLLAYAGCYPSEAYIRLTTPVTVKARRRQGLFSALFARSVGAARGRFASARIVVVAQPGSAPERLYRSLGFAVAGYQYAILV